MTRLSEVGRARGPERPFRPDFNHLVLPPRLELTHPLAETPSFLRAVTGMRSLIDRAQIGLIDGPPGTGKTTFAQWAAEQSGLPSAIAVMPENPAPLDLLRISITAVTGCNPSGQTKTEMEAEMIAALSEWQGLLILDEIQNVRSRGLNESRYLHDMTRPKFPLLLVGAGALPAVKESAPLDSRVRFKRVFKTLRGEDLFATVRTIDPRFVDVADNVIRYADDRYAQGNLRRWVSIVETLQDFGVERAERNDIDDVIAVTGAA